MNIIMEKTDGTYSIEFDKHQILNIRNRVVETFLNVDEKHIEVPYVKLKEYNDQLLARQNFLTFNMFGDIIPGNYRPEGYKKGDEDRMFRLTYSECDISSTKVPSIVQIINNMVYGRCLDLNELVNGPSEEELTLFADNIEDQKKLISFYREALSCISAEKIQVKTL